MKLTTRAYALMFVLAFVIGLVTTGPFAPAAHASTTYSRIQAFLHSNSCEPSPHRCGHLFSKSGRNSWDGRYSYSEKTEYCVELFNGRNHSIRPFGLWDDAMNPNAYWKVCQDGNYYVNQGKPFRHMRRWHAHRCHFVRRTPTGTKHCST